MTALTRADLIADLATRMGGYKRLTVTGGSTTTIVDTGDLVEVDDAWNGSMAYVLTDAGGAGAAPQGEERPVVDYDQGDATLTVSPAYSAAVASGDTVELYPIARTTLTRAINLAIRAAGTTWLIPTVDTSTVTIAEDTYSYTLPTDLVYLLAVATRDATDKPWGEVPANAWAVVWTAGAPTLYLERMAGLAAGDSIRLDYLKRVAEMGTDAAALGLGEPAEREMVAFVHEYALAVLHEGKALTGNFREHLTLAKQHYDTAEEMRRRAPVLGGPGRVKGVRHARARG